MTKQLHVISHTHWDFEWYFSAHESLIQLIYHLDEVMDALEKGEVDTYYLDGQLSIVEDFLQACPHQKTRLCALVSNGKLKIGPWYTQTCQLIVSGESIVRNLQLGIRLGRALGKCEMLGYVPDAFGQSMDMPKIYNGVGIDNTVFWRGLSTDVYPYREGRWQSEDGSLVYFYNIKDGYYVGGQLIYSEDANALVLQVEKDCLSLDVALPLGGDQRFVDKNVKARIAHFNEKLAKEKINAQLVESTYTDLFRALKSQDLPIDTLSGEMIDGQISKIHRSIYSSRSDHKRLNDLLERQITLELEPLMALATRFNIPYQSELIHNLWRLMTRNHAHDSAGGCNTDKTNKIIVERFEQAQQMSGAARDYLVRKLAVSQPSLKKGARLTLFNTLAIARSQVQTVILSTKTTHFSIHSLEGENIAFEILKQSAHYNGAIERDPKNNDPKGYYYQTTLALRVPLPPLGFVSLVIFEDINTSVEAIEKPQTQQIENHRYHVELEKGKLHITDKQSGQRLNNAMEMRDGGDDGDTYDYSPPLNDWMITLGFDDATCLSQCGDLKQTLTLKGEWRLPKNLHSRAQGLRDAVCKYSLCLTLNQDDSPLEIDFDIDNQCEDHRLVCVFNAPIHTQQSHADTPFGFARRPHYQTQLKNWRALGWKEEPSGIYPMINYANLHDENMSFTVMAQGVKEYEVLIEGPKIPSGKLALTLFRSVGFLGKPDLARRPGIASGQQYKYIPTPDSQMKGQQCIKLGVCIDRTFCPAKITQTWQAWGVNLPYYQAQSLNQFTNTLQYFVMHPLQSAVSDAFNLIKLDAPHLICSAIEYNNDALFVRLFNPAEQPVENAGRLFSEYLKCAEETNLLLETQNPLEIKNRSIALGHFRPKQIRTFKMQLYPQDT